MASEWHAVEVLSKAVDKTKELLLKKFDLGFWLKLALIVFLVSGSGSFNPSSGFGGDNKNKQGFAQNIAALMPVIIVVIAVVLIIVLVFSFISSVCQFMFIETLESKRVELIAGFRRNLDGGFNLFLFNIGLGLISLIIVLIALSPVIYMLLKEPGTGFTAVLLILIVAEILAMLLFFIVMSIIGMFTNDFAIVIMHSERKGIINAWKRVLAMVKSNMKQFGVYIILKLVLGIAAAITLTIVSFVITIIALLAIVVLAISIGIIIFVAAIALGIDTGMLAWLLIPAIIIAIVYLILVSYLVVVVTLPIPVFFRYYSILFLQKIEPKLSLIKEVNEKRDGEGKKDKEPRRSKEDNAKARKKSEKKLKVY